MPISTILSSLRTLVAATTGVPAANVHNGLRWASQESDFRELFVDDSGASDLIHAWMITRRGTSEKIVGTNNLSIIEHRISVIGVYGLNDATTGTSATSEVAFRTIVDEVLATIRQNYTINGAVMNSGPPFVEIEEHRMFHGKLCHYVEITFAAKERVNYNP